MSADLETYTQSKAGRVALDLSTKIKSRQVGFGQDNACRGAGGGGSGGRGADVLVFSIGAFQMPKDGRVDHTSD